eukprot:TRINITY_DN5056_c0_g1_i1.p1 TRINITY_DN5056_c0_g1~~TRINITY_DN5056_c0_g1_i1.p1  ORF type:complete len:2061 (-),score=322.90 TRINITY_DN5056_c0_g1_i1:6-6107(-)
MAMRGPQVAGTAEAAPNPSAELVPSPRPSRSLLWLALLLALTAVVPPLLLRQSSLLPLTRDDVYFQLQVSGTYTLELVPSGNGGSACAGAGRGGAEAGLGNGRGPAGEQAGDWGAWWRGTGARGGAVEDAEVEWDIVLRGPVQWPAKPPMASDVESDRCQWEGPDTETVLRVPEARVGALSVEGSAGDDRLVVVCGVSRCPLDVPGQLLVWSGGEEATAEGDELAVVHAGAMSFHSEPIDGASGEVFVMTLSHDLRHEQRTCAQASPALVGPLHRETAHAPRPAACEGAARRGSPGGAENERGHMRSGEVLSSGPPADGTHWRVPPLSHNGRRVLSTLHVRYAALEPVFATSRELETASVTINTTATSVTVDEGTDPDTVYVFSLGSAGSMENHTFTPPPTRLVLRSTETEATFLFKHPGVDDLDVELDESGTIEFVPHASGEQQIFKTLRVNGGNVVFNGSRVLVEEQLELSNLASFEGEGIEGDESCLKTSASSTVFQIEVLNSLADPAIIVNENFELSSSGAEIEILLRDTAAVATQDNNGIAIFGNIFCDECAGVMVEALSDAPREILCRMGGKIKAGSAPVTIECKTSAVANTSYTPVLWSADVVSAGHLRVVGHHTNTSTAASAVPRQSRIGVRLGLGEEPIHVNATSMHLEGKGGSSVGTSLHEDRCYGVLVAPNTTLVIRDDLFISGTGGSCSFSGGVVVEMPLLLEGEWTCNATVGGRMDVHGVRGVVPGVNEIHDDGNLSGVFLTGSIYVESETLEVRGEGQGAEGYGAGVIVGDGVTMRASDSIVISGTADGLEVSRKCRDFDPCRLVGVGVVLEDCHLEADTIAIDGTGGRNTEARGTGVRIQSEALLLAYNELNVIGSAGFNSSSDSHGVSLSDCFLESHGEMSIVAHGSYCATGISASYCEALVTKNSRLTADRYMFLEGIGYAPPVNLNSNSPGVLLQDTLITASGGGMVRGIGANFAAFTVGSLGGRNLCHGVEILRGSRMRWSGKLLIKGTSTALNSDSDGVRVVGVAFDGDALAVVGHTSAESSGVTIMPGGGGSDYRRIIASELTLTGSGSSGVHVMGYDLDVAGPILVNGTGDILNTGEDPLFGGVHFDGVTAHGTELQVYGSSVNCGIAKAAVGLYSVNLTMVGNGDITGECAFGINSTIGVFAEESSLDVGGVLSMRGAGDVVGVEVNNGIHLVCAGASFTDISPRPTSRRGIMISGTDNEDRLVFESSGDVSFDGSFAVQYADVTVTGGQFIGSALGISHERKEDENPCTVLFVYSEVIVDNPSVSYALFITASLIEGHPRSSLGMCTSNANFRVPGSGIFIQSSTLPSSVQRAGLQVAVAMINSNLQASRVLMNARMEVQPNPLGRAPAAVFLNQSTIMTSESIEIFATVDQVLGARAMEAHRCTFLAPAINFQCSLSDGGDGPVLLIIDGEVVHTPALSESPGTNAGVAQLTASSGRALGTANASPEYGAALVLQSTSVSGFDEVLLEASGDGSRVDGVLLKGESTVALPDPAALLVVSALGISTQKVPLVVEAAVALDVQDILFVYASDDGFLLSETAPALSARPLEASHVGQRVYEVDADTAQIHPRYAYLFQRAWSVVNPADATLTQLSPATVRVNVTGPAAAVQAASVFRGSAVASTAIALEGVPLNTNLMVELSVSVGGPYETAVGVPLVLDNARVSGELILTRTPLRTEPIAADQISLSWDLDGDGVYGDATELQPLFVHVLSEGDWPIALRAAYDGTQEVDVSVVSVGTSSGTPDGLLSPPDPQGSGDGEEEGDKGQITDAPPVVLTSVAPPPPVTAPSPAPTPPTLVQVDEVRGGRSTLVRTGTLEVVLAVEVAEADRPVRLSPVDPATLPPARRVSDVVDISLERQSTGPVRLQGNAEICFQLSDESTLDNRCLGFFDESSMKWRCEDRCLERKDGLACGRTGHFTNFAVLIGGGGGTGSDDPCESENPPTITGSPLWDSLLSAFVALGVICICAVFFVISFVPSVRKVIYGKEGARILQQRDNMHSTGSTATAGEHEL